MLKERLRAADAVQSTFVPAEQAADHAALECARSVVAMLESRQAARLPLSIGLDPLARTINALSLFAQGRRELIEAHPLLDQAARSIGLKPSMFGKDDPPQAILPERTTATT